MTLVGLDAYFAYIWRPFALIAAYAGYRMTAPLRAAVERALCPGAAAGLGGRGRGRRRKWRSNGRRRRRAAEAASPSVWLRQEWRQIPPSREVVDLIAENLALAVAGPGAAIRRFLRRRHRGRHRQRLLAPGAARGARRAPLLHGESGDRGAHLRAGGRLRPARHSHQRGRAWLDRHRALRLRPSTRRCAQLHPLGRAGQAAEVAEVVAAPAVAGARASSTAPSIPVDGGRAALGVDPRRARFSSPSKKSARPGAHHRGEASSPDARP